MWCFAFHYCPGVKLSDALNPRYDQFCCRPHGKNTLWLHTELCSQKHSSSLTLATGQHFKHFWLHWNPLGLHFGNIKAQHAPQHSPAASLACSNESVAASC